MSNLLKQIIIFFIAIIFSNIIVDLAIGAEKTFLVRPIPYFGTALVISIIGGYLANLVNIRAMGKKEV